MDLTRFDATLMAIGFGGHLLLFAVLLRSRLYRTFPIFFTYIGYCWLTDIIFFVLFRHVSAKTYFWAYFSNNVPELLLQLGILLEVGWNVLNPVRQSLSKAALYMFMTMLFFGTFAALLLSMHSQQATLDRWVGYFLHLNFAMAILRMAVFAAIAGFAQMLGIGWKNHVLQIATGDLSYSIAVLLVELLHSHTNVLTNPTMYHLQEQFRIISWCMALGYWSYALSRVEAPRKEFSPKMADFLVSIAEASRNNRIASSREYRK
jgi:hypothetical protein